MKKIAFSCLLWVDKTQINYPISRNPWQVIISGPVHVDMRLGYVLPKGQVPSATRLSSRPRPPKDLKNSWRHRIESIFQPSMNGIRRYWRFWSGRMLSLSMPIFRTIGACMWERHPKYAAAAAIFPRNRSFFCLSKQFCDAKLVGAE